MWQLMICISFISLFPFMFAGRLNNALLCLYQRVILGIQKRDRSSESMSGLVFQNGFQRDKGKWFSRIR